eukprot:6892914-Alexandrium_andersonii.AAC.1
MSAMSAVVVSCRCRHRTMVLTITMAMVRWPSRAQTRPLGGLEEPSLCRCFALSATRATRASPQLPEG